METNKVDFSQTNGLTTADFFEVCKTACKKSKRFTDFFFAQLILGASNHPTDKAHIWLVRVLVQGRLPMEANNVRRAWNQAVADYKAE